MNAVQIEVVNNLQYQLAKTHCGQKNRVYRQLETQIQCKFSHNTTDSVVPVENV